MKTLTRIAWSMAAAAMCVALAGCLSDEYLSPQFQARLSKGYRPKAVLRPIKSDVTVFDLFKPEEFKAKYDALLSGGNTLAGYSQALGPIPKSRKEKAREVGANVVLMTLKPMMRFDSPDVYEFAFWSTKVRAN